MANVNLIKQDNSTKVNITKGATQQALNSAVAQAESYRNESEGFSLDAEGFKNDASLSASQSAISATASATSATSSATSATNATTQANIATTKASEASTSASNALVSETNASTYATNASNSAIASANSATASATSESNALTYSNNASTSASNAATSESNASGYATSAATSASNAAISEANALSYANSINPSTLLHTQGNGNGDPEGYTTAETDTLLSDKADNATTLSGYGITDAYTKTEVDNKPSGFKNYIINGNFDIWQRGTNQTTKGYGSDDRWFNTNDGSTKTHSRVICTDTERTLFNASYFSRTVVSSVAGAGNFVIKRTSIEDVTRLAGKTVTLSFWAKADSSKNIWIEFKQMFGTGGSPSPTVLGLYGQAVSLTSTWQKKTITLTLPSIIGKTLGTDGLHTSATEIQFWFDVGSENLGRIPTGVQQSGTFDIAQVQLEEGSVATPFENRPYGLELSLCQRYYQRTYNFDATIFWSGNTTSGSTYYVSNVFPVPMRVTPSMLILDSNYTNFDTIAITSTSYNGCRLEARATSTGNGMYVRAIYSASAEL